MTLLLSLQIYGDFAEALELAVAGPLPDVAVDLASAAAVLPSALASELATAGPLLVAASELATAAAGPLSDDALASELAVAPLPPLAVESAAATAGPEPACRRTHMLMSQLPPVARLASTSLMQKNSLQAWLFGCLQAVLTTKWRVLQPGS